MSEPPKPHSSARDFLDPQTLARLGGLKLRARQVVEGVLAGLHRSPHKGSSVEFAEYKEYSPGDEIRHIDWKAFAKSDKYYVKQYEEETNLRAYLVMDTSGSMRFDSHGISKLDYARTLTASLAYLLLRQGDAAGLLLFDEKPGVYLPPSGRSRHLDDLITLLKEIPTSGEQGTSLEQALGTVAERVRRRSVIVLISDMLDGSDQVQHLLKVLRSRRMDVVLFHLIDPDELTLPYEGLTMFEGLEQDGSLLVDPDDIRDAYQAMFQEHLDSIEQTCRETAIDYHRVVTDRPFEGPLLDLLMKRRGRRR